MTHKKKEQHTTKHESRKQFFKNGHTTIVLEKLKEIYETQKQYNT